MWSRNCFSDISWQYHISSTEKTFKPWTKVNTYYGVAKEIEFWILGTQMLRKSLNNHWTFGNLWKPNQHLCLMKRLPTKTSGFVVWMTTVCGIFIKSHLFCWLSTVSYVLCNTNQDSVKKQICPVHLHRWMPLAVFECICCVVHFGGGLCCFWRSRLSFTGVNSEFMKLVIFYCYFIIPHTASLCLKFHIWCS